jgi:hypothetical protein
MTRPRRRRIAALMRAALAALSALPAVPARAETAAEAYQRLLRERAAAPRVRFRDDPTDVAGKA